MAKERLCYVCVRGFVPEGDPYEGMCQECALKYGTVVDDGEDPTENEDEWDH